MYGRKRLLIFNPDIQPNSFVFFFSRGDSGIAYSIRDYWGPGMRLYYANDVRGRSGRSLTADEIIAGSKIVIDAPAHRVEDLNFWRKLIGQTNAMHLGITSLPPRTVSPTLGMDQRRIDAPPPQSSSQPFPVLNLETLRRLPKAAKRGDLDRILYSPNSEDYVTWNWLQLLLQRPASEWWPAVIRLVAQDRAAVSSLDPADFPHAEPWSAVHPPAEYEQSSRDRMLKSANPDWRARAADPAPVEGVTEVDLTFTGKRYLVYVEAKLGSDVSLRTKFDPFRDQIARSIDCLLDSIGTRSPHFWMFVRDRDEQRAYMQLMHTYRKRPENLGYRLAHRSCEQITQVASTLAVVLWSDLLTVLGHVVDLARGPILRELKVRTA